MTPRLYAALDDTVTAVLERLGRVGLLGWVDAAALRVEIPDCPSDQVMDLVVRRLVKAGVVELWRPQYPPTSYRQQLRLVHALEEAA